MYDPAIARWNVVDPLAELEFDQSGFNYVGNNSLLYTDPTGMKRRKNKHGTWWDDEDNSATVYAKGPGSKTSSYSLIDLAFMSRARNKAIHGEASPYGQHFQDGGNFAVGAVATAVGAGMLASVPIVANSVSAGASYMANLRYASAGRWLLRKSFDMKGAKTLWKSKIALSLTAQGMSAYFNDAPLKFDVVDVISDVFTTPLIGAIAGSQFDLNINMSEQVSGNIGNFSKGGASDFTWGLASNLSDGVISKYGGKALGGVSEFKNFSLQLYQKAYFQMFNDVSKSDK